jgi:hypothetical protein
MKNRKRIQKKSDEKSDEIGWALKRTNASAEKRALGLLA